MTYPATAKTSIPERPLLAGYYEVVPMAADRLVLRSAGRVVRLAGSGIVEHATGLFDSLDGTSTVGAISQRLGIDEDVLVSLVGHLTAEGLVADAADPRWRADGDATTHEAYRQMGVPGGAVEAALRSARVAIAGSGPVIRRVADHLQDAGVRDVLQLATDPKRPLAEAVESASLVVVEAEPGGERAEVINRACLEHNIPALFFSVTPQEATIGPLVRPFASACYHCARCRRLAQLRFYEEEIAYETAIRRGRLFPRPPTLLPAWTAVVAGLIALDAERHLGATGRPATLGAVLVAHSAGLEVRREEVLPVPDCPECGGDLDIDVGAHE